MHSRISILSPWLRWILPLVVFTTTVISQSQQTYLGFDRNDYPGRANIAALRNTFTFTGYWLNNPPGANRNTWQGKRSEVQSMGYGFLLLFNGREYRELKAPAKAAGLGAADAAAAVLAAKRDGFPPDAIVFLDQEQGGRMLPEQRAYIYAWVDAIVHAGYRAGIYCSGIAFRESNTVSVVTANDIREHAVGRSISFFIANDECGPSPGCAFPKYPPAPAQSGVMFADAWQFAQSPRRPDMTASCRQTYAADGNCYPHTLPSLFVDVDTATSRDPSHGRSR